MTVTLRQRVAWFVEYRRRIRRGWGVFTGLAAERFDIPAAGGDRSAWEATTREHADWFDTLSPRQRRRLHSMVVEEMSTVRYAGGTK